jgi:hypothetical protein
MSERRYSEDEVAEIFEQATEAQKVAVRPSHPGEGLTLAELQAIGRDVGIPPELVAKAARSLASGGTQLERRKLFGLPIRVGHTVELDRPLTDPEWQHLVVDLRETFDARGKLKDDGPFKQWTNGNLEALLEPKGSGQRLRLRTFRESAMGMLLGGGITLGIATVALIGALISGDAADRMAGFLTLFAIGLGLVGAPAIQLPAWARLRKSQMEGVAERVALLAGSPDSGVGPTEP